ncbi:hypothetical protein F4780DRAFT_278948 [Xylariomycetidae sp. FL0641]|nr:hypothetical protein F4780DRAFT_278948 [Xylariomycetidae sp. FL0641]
MVSCFVPVRCASFRSCRFTLSVSLPVCLSLAPCPKFELRRRTVLLPTTRTCSQFHGSNIKHLCLRVYIYIYIFKASIGLSTTRPLVRWLHKTRIGAWLVGWLVGWFPESLLHENLPVYLPYLSIYLSTCRTHSIPRAAPRAYIHKYFSPSKRHPPPRRPFAAGPATCRRGPVDAANHHPEATFSAAAARLLRSAPASLFSRGRFGGRRLARETRYTR